MGYYRPLLIIASVLMSVRGAPWGYDGYGHPPGNQYPSSTVPNGVNGPRSNIPGSGTNTVTNLPGSRSPSRANIPGSVKYSRPNTPGSGNYPGSNLPGSGPHSRPNMPGTGPYQRATGSGSGTYPRPTVPGVGPHQRPMSPGTGPHQRPMSPGTGPHQRPMPPGSAGYPTHGTSGPGGFGSRYPQSPSSGMGGFTTVYSSSSSGGYHFNQNGGVLTGGGFQHHDSMHNGHRQNRFSGFDYDSRRRPQTIVYGSGSPGGFPQGPSSVCRLLITKSPSASHPFGPSNVHCRENGRASDIETMRIVDGLSTQHQSEFPQEHFW